MATVEKSRDAAGQATAYNNLRRLGSGISTPTNKVPTRIVRLRARIADLFRG